MKDVKLIMTVERMKDRDAWLRLRTLGIGGSDAGIIAGLNRWKSPFQLWLEKTGQEEPKELENNEYIYWGRVLESAVAQRFMEETGKQVRKQGMLQNKTYPWMLANVDRMIVGEDAGLECKTTNSFAGKEWDGDTLPDAYYVQCQHYMMVTGTSRWYIACLIGGNHYVQKTIERNEEDIRALFALEQKFWIENVQQNKMPPVDGSANCRTALQQRFSQTNGDAVTPLSEKVAQLVTELQAFKDGEKKTKEQIKKLENQICVALGSYEIGELPDGHKISWKTQAGRTTVDSKKLKEELPDVYKKYSKIGKPIRVLRV